MKLIGFAVVLYLVILALFFVTQRRLMYYPSRSYLPLSQAHANRAFQEISVRTDDAIELKAWYAPATTKPLTIIFFHGNGDCLYNAAPIGDPYIDAGYGFLLAEYRGYSGLPGNPTEAGLYNDARAYIHELMARKIETRHIILFGQSLGTGVATQMAEEFPVGGLILLAPYLSIPKLAKAHFPFFPADYVALDRFENEKKIAKIHTSLLIVHGAEDRTVPLSQGNKLFLLANEPKEFHSLPDREHNDAFDAFAPISLDWISRVCHAN
jgi:fermentation-respiration switch protein FrsA (DUF1100 family)